MVRLRDGGGRGRNSPKVTRLLHRAKAGSISRRQKRARAQQEGEARTSERVSEAAERPPTVPCLREEDHTCQQRRSDVKRAGTASLEHSSDPGVPRKSENPSLVPLPKLTLPASGVVAVRSGSKTHKPRPCTGTGGGVQRPCRRGARARQPWAARRTFLVICSTCYFSGASRPNVQLVSRGLGRPAPSQGRS